LSDISGELAKRISRRQFLFGGRNSGGGGSEAGVLGTILGAAGLGVGVMALGSPGPNASSFTDKYATIASLNRRLNVELVDEFILGFTETGEIGELNWSSQLSSGSIVYVLWAANHPGIVRAQTTLIANSFAIILAPGTTLVVPLNELWDISFISRFSGANTNVIISLGCSQAFTVPDSNAGIVFMFDSASNTNWQALVVDDNNVVVGQVVTSVTGSLNTWHLFRIKRLADSVEFYIDDVLEATISLGISSVTEGSQIGFGVKTTNTTQKTLDVDFFKLLLTVNR